MSWLVLAGRLGSEFDEELGSVFKPPFCTISDMGFSDSADGAIADRPPRPDTVPYDSWCSERSMVVRPDENIRALGRAELCEAHVYDNRYRGDIDFTGIKITISLQPDVYAAYAKHLGRAKVPDLADYDSWNGCVVLRVPVSEFTFPVPRGSTHPWDNKNVVGKLRPIRRFNFDAIEIRMLRGGPERQGMLEKGDKADDGNDVRPALRIGAMSGSPRWWARLFSG